MTNESSGLEPLKRLTRDVRAASDTLGLEEIRYLVDSYYALQEYRKATGNQELALSKSKEPPEVINWIKIQTEMLEGQIKGVLDRWTSQHPLSARVRGVVGIGPVIAAGLAAHIDMEKATTAGCIWNFAGLNPSIQWEKGEKRPWNGGLKTLCWKIGESFVKVSGNPNDIYGKLYLQRKEYEQRKNEASEYADQAAAKLARFKIGKSTEAYKAYSSGKLPAGHVHARAKRWAVKLFLSHYHTVGREMLGLPLVKPWVIEHGGHVDYIPPDW